MPRQKSTMATAMKRLDQPEELKPSTLYFVTEPKRNVIQWKIPSARSTKGIVLMDKVRVFFFWGALCQSIKILPCAHSGTSWHKVGGGARFEFIPSDCTVREKPRMPLFP
jgi:hypothetical protein